MDQNHCDLDYSDQINSGVPNDEVRTLAQVGRDYLQPNYKQGKAATVSQDEVGRRMATTDKAAICAMFHEKELEQIYLENGNVVVQDACRDA